jgi:hypothetical protein
MPENAETTEVKPAEGEGAESTETETATTPTVESLAADVAKWKAMSRKNEADKKAALEKAKKFDDLENANKTELQKLLDRAEAAEKRANENDLKVIKADVAVAKGVPASLLSGTTQEELEASADALLAFRGEVKPPAIEFGAGKGKADVSKAKVEQLTREALKGMPASEIVKARSEGKLEKLMNPKGI